MLLGVEVLLGIEVLPGIKVLLGTKVLLGVKVELGLDFTFLLITKDAKIIDIMAITITIITSILIILY